MTKTNHIPKGFRKGVGLVEVMAAVVILIIILLGSSYLYVAGRGQLAKQQKNQVALNLASQRLEELKAEPYENIKIGESHDVAAVGETPYVRTIETTDKGVVKQVKVTVQWSDGSDTSNHEISLVTRIAP